MRSASSSNAIVGTVRRLVPVSRGNLIVRAVSALVLAPLVLAVTYLGSPYFDGMVTAAAAVLAWEWCRLCGGGTLKRPAPAAIGAVTAAMAAALLREYAIAGWIIAAGAMAVAVLALRERDGTSHLYALGVVYMGLAGLCLIWLREHPANGMAVVIWIFVLVWATDTTAYVAGSLIGGAKLAPKISPNKTWAGFFGGLAGAGVIGALAGLHDGLPDPLRLAFLSAILGIVSQAGDLFESSIKRRFQVKDASNLIPGHGGLFDRVDGLLAVGLAVALLVRLSGGAF